MASYCFGGSKKARDGQGEGGPSSGKSSRSRESPEAGEGGHTRSARTNGWAKSGGPPNGHVASGTLHGAVVSKEMCFYCFDVLLASINGSSAPHTPSFTNKPYPLFVTWSTGKEKKLRGCIGTFSEQSLHNGLKEYALSSALKDSRFSPISRNETYRLNCAVSLLINFESNLKYLDWEVGIHGIRIEFNDDRGISRSATYLPEVALEQGWGHIAAIDSLVHKAGYKGLVSEELRQSIRLTRYQSEKCCVTYEEYSRQRHDAY